jgi:hypothetical protein
MHAVREALGKDRRVVLWRNDVGAVSRTVRGKNVHTRYGLAVGSSDLIGVLSPSGRFVAIECKAATGRTTEEQDLFLALVRRFGGFACVVRSVEDAIKAVDRACAGERE